MNPHLKNLIAAVVSYVTEHGGYITKTKLLKLLYLFDVEYYQFSPVKVFRYARSSSTLALGPESSTRW